MKFHPQVAAKLRTPEIIEILARGAHEANRTYCLTLGDQSQPDWDNAPDWQKASIRKGVMGVLTGNSPEDSHKSWLAQKQAEGWTYGPIKDPEKKEHPCFVPYADLSAADRAKDTLFVTTVKTLTNALHHQLGLTPPPRDYATQTSGLNFTIQQVFHLPACSSASHDDDRLIDLFWDFQDDIQKIFPTFHFPDSPKREVVAENIRMLTFVDDAQGFLLYGSAARHKYLGNGVSDIEGWNQTPYLVYADTYDEAFDQLVALVQQQRDQERAEVPA